MTENFRDAQAGEMTDSSTRLRTRDGSFLGRGLYLKHLPPDLLTAQGTDHRGIDPAKHGLR